MAVPAVFTLLLAYMCSVFCHLHEVQFWAPSPLPPFCRDLIFMSTDQPTLVTMVGTHNTTQFCVITAHQTGSQKHMQFKLPYPRATSATMPLLLNVELPSSSSQKSGFVTATSVSTAASTASNGNFVDDDFLLLSRLQGIPIYAPPGPWPLRTGARVSTKTQNMADNKSKKGLKQKAVEGKNVLPPLARLRGSPKSRET
jgi:hypothetical protein